MEYILQDMLGVQNWNDCVGWGTMLFSCTSVLFIQGLKSKICLPEPEAQPGHFLQHCGWKQACLLLRDNFL